MKICTITTAIFALGLLAASVRAESLVSPFKFTCSDYINAQKDARHRGKANVMVYWATGYLQARLAPLPTTKFSAKTFGKDLRDVHAVLLRICPNIPNMVISKFMDNLAGDMEKTGKAK